jgi:tetratricopeptide (TPR) repeat protein
MLRKTAIFSIFLIFAVSLAQICSAQKPKDLDIVRENNKIALGIGNSNYQNGFSKLNSPKNDAVKMAEALKRLGFRIVGGGAQIDVSYRDMESLLDKFTEEIKHAGVGFFYFSGHGSQDNNRDNFLIPVDTSIKYQSDLKFTSLKVEHVTSRMEEAGNRLNILVLDACRNNTLPSGFKSGVKGLNTSNGIPSGVYIAYAARDGQTAADGAVNGFSLYTGELLKNIETPNVRLEDVFMKTRNAVKQQTDNAQYPFDYGSLDGVYYFKYDEQVLSASNTTPTSDRIKEADSFYNAGADCPKEDYDCQISNYSKAINLNPNHAWAYINRCNAYDGKEEYDRAIRDCDKALELDPKHSFAYNNRGNAYQGKDEYDRAIGDYDKAIELDPKYIAAYNNRGNAYHSKGEYDLAIKDYDKANQLDPTFVFAYSGRCISYYRKKNYDLAVKECKKAIELDPKFTIAYFNRGYAYYAKNDYDLAIKDFDKTIELDPKDSDVYNARANAYDDKGDRDKAIRDYDKAIALKPDNADAFYNRGLSYRLKGDYSQAVRDYTKAIEINHNDPDSYEGRAIAYDALGEKQKAQADRDKVEELKKKP